MSRKHFSIGVDFEEFCLALHGHHPSYLVSSIVDDFTDETFFLLELLSSLGITATFFVSSHTASFFKDLILLISSMGHEIASHGHKHIPRQLMDDKSFLYDCQYSRAFLEDLVSIPVAGYRSPLLSISRSDYVSSLHILKSAGYRYDSSIIYSKYKELKERLVSSALSCFSVVPLADINIMGRCINVAGGSIWRLAPPRLISALLLSRFTSDDSSFYVHPYEFSSCISYRRISPHAKRRVLRDLFAFLRWNINNGNTTNILRIVCSRSTVESCSRFCPPFFIAE